MADKALITCTIPGTGICCKYIVYACIKKGHLQLLPVLVCTVECLTLAQDWNCVKRHLNINGYSRRKTFKYHSKTHFLVEKYLRNTLHLKNLNEKQNLYKQLHFFIDILR